MPSRSPSNSPFARGRTAPQARRLLSAFLPLQGGGQVGVCEVSSCTHSRTGFHHPGIQQPAPTEPWRGGRRGAPPGTEKGYGMERYRPPRRTGVSAGHPHGGQWSRVFVTGCGGKAIALRLPGAGPSASAGLWTRPVSGNRATGTISVPRQPDLLSQAHPGLTCLGPGGTVCLPQGPSCPCPPDQNGT